MTSQQQQQDELQESVASLFSLDLPEIEEKPDKGKQRMLDQSQGDFSFASTGTAIVGDGVLYMTLRSIAVVVLIISAGALSYLAYIMARDKEQDEFEAKVRGFLLALRGISINPTLITYNLPPLGDSSKILQMRLLGQASTMLAIPI